MSGSDSPGVAVSDATHALQRRNDVIRLLLETGRRLARTLDLVQIYDILHEAVTQLMPCTTLIVSRYNPEQQIISSEYVRHQGKRQAIDHLPPIPLEPEGYGIQSRAIRRGEALHIADWQAEIERVRTAYVLNDESRIIEVLPAEESLTASGLVVPMKLEDAVTGVVQVMSNDLGAYGEEDLHFVETLAMQVAAAAANARLYHRAQQEIAIREQAEAAEREQRVLAEALAHTADILNRTLDLDEVLDRILEQVGRVVKHQGANVMLIKDGIARVRRHHGYHREYAMSPFLMDFGYPLQEASTLQAMIRTRRATVIGDTAAFDGWLNTPDGNWVRSYAGAPIIMDDDVIGFLNLDAATPHFFRSEHGERLQAFAQQVAVALRNAQLYEAEQKRRHIAETLTEAAAALNATLDLDQVLLRILEQLGKVIPYDSASVQQLEGDALLIRAAKGFKDTARLLNRRTSVSLQRPSNQVLRDRRPLTVDDISKQVSTFPVSGDMSAFGKIRSWLGIPLVANDAVLGLITVDRHRVQPFSREEVALAQTFGNHAAMAMHNAQLYEQLARHSDYLESAVDARTAELQRTVEQMDAIVNHSPQAILLVDREGHIQRGNPAVQDLFGHDLDTLSGRLLRDLVSNERAADLQTTLDEVRTLQQSRRLQSVAQRKDGADFDADITLAPIVEEGRASSLICSVHDISGLKEVERMKDAFVSNVSHELRTPISSLKLYHGLLQRNPSKQAVYIERMEREIDRLSVIIEDLLRLSRLEQGHADLVLRPADLRQLVDQHVTDRRPLAERRGLSLSLRESLEPAPVEMDEGLIGQVFSIILTNALNYTPAGGHIDVGFLRKEQEQQGYYGFYVRDDGPGIAAHEKAQLFQRFFRGDVGRRSGASGTGLGLSIADEIVRQHHGQIEIESEGRPGEGATFRVWLPESNRHQQESL